MKAEINVTDLTLDSVSIWALEVGKVYHSPNLFIIMTGSDDGLLVDKQTGEITCLAFLGEYLAEQYDITRVDPTALTAKVIIA